ncbi:MAG: bifunctional hydroxymethylpyrimidine kinase/phosphomethylpyrimidine kinase [Hyphomonadaceae bacterium]
MIAKGGAALLEPDAVEVIRDQLVPAATLVTPNAPEAEALTGVEVGGSMGRSMRPRCWWSSLARTPRW